MIAALRDLLARAEIGPIQVGPPTPLRPTWTLFDIPFGGGDIAEAYCEERARAIAATLNAAPSLLDISEAVRAFRAEWDRDGNIDYPKRHELRMAMYAALDALETDK